MIQVQQITRQLFYAASMHKEHYLPPYSFLVSWAVVPILYLICIFLLLDQSQLEMSIQNIGLNSVSITWSRAIVDVGQIFTLEISHGSELITSVSLNESYYTFSAPEGSAPCEVYYFSITATYIGARYIGAGCSASSPVLSRMLPSLPDIKGLERSLKYSIAIEQLSQDVILNVSFEVCCCNSSTPPLIIINFIDACTQPASDCEQYSVSYYSLEIQDTLNGTTVQFIVENFTATNIIPKNAVYNFTIIVSNLIGNVSTKSRTFCKLHSFMCMHAIASEDLK